MLKTYVQTQNQLYIVEDCNAKELKMDIEYDMQHGRLFFALGNGSGGIDFINIYHISKIWDNTLDKRGEYGI